MFKCLFYTRGPYNNRSNNNYSDSKVTVWLTNSNNGLTNITKYV